MTLRTIARVLDPVEPATSLRALIGQHFSDTPIVSLAELARRHTHPQRSEQDFFVFNTFLMDIPFSGRKPAVEYRDAEIGRAISDRSYDLICLSEVWHREERLDLLENLDFAHTVAHRSGGRGVNAVQIGGSAGLVTVSRDLPIVADHDHEYQNESGSDSNAAKGVLLTVHEIEWDTRPTPSSLNIFSTHLNAQGVAKYAQVLELAYFIWQTKDKVRGDRSRPGRPGLNASIVAGDFNIDRESGNGVDTAEYAALASRWNLPDIIVRAITNVVNEDGEITPTTRGSKTGFELLTDVLAALGFVDLWGRRNGTPGSSSGLNQPGVVDVIALPADDDESLCNDDFDSAAIDALTSRPTAIDHVFVSRNTDVMSFTIDYTRPRRPRTERDPAAPEYGDGGLTFLSDHLGIQTTLLLSPR